VGLYWDASLSRESAPRDQELRAVERCLQRAGDIEVDVPPPCRPDHPASAARAAYLVRNPPSRRKPVCLDGHKAALYRSRMNPFLGRNVEPLVCSLYGQRLSVVRLVTDSVATARILDHLGLSTPEAENPPPMREVLRVAEPGEGWGLPAEWK
jgi:hypothetical protein